MDKIKISLASGSSLEKPLVSAFKSNNAIYVVFDNELNGTMGLPIILVSKLDNGKLVKITDVNEWNSIKEILRMIIAGNQVDYVMVDANLPADDMFFMQLTLPVASFDALKNNYRPNVDNAGAVPNSATMAPEMVNPPMGEMSAPAVEPVLPNAQMNVQNGTPVAVNPSDVQMPVENVNVAPNMVMPDDQAVAQEPVVPPQPDISVAPVSEMPASTVEPVMPSAPVNAQNVAPVMPDNTPAEPVSPVPEMPSSAPITDAMNQVTSTPMDFTADKEAFLKACENMFDALVAKFKNQ